jgi:hypothetical protein
MKGHVIHFEHSGKHDVAKVLPRTDLSESLSVAYVGSREAWSGLTSTAVKRQAFLRKCPQTSINVDNVYEFLAIKKAVDPAYADIEIDHTVATRKLMSEMPELILLSTFLADCEASMRIDDEVSANVARSADEQVTATTDVLSDSTTEPAELDNIYVHQPVLAPTLSSDAILRATQSATVNLQPNVNISVDRNPMNEFGDNDKILIGGFPDKFLLGRHRLSLFTFLMTQYVPFRRRSACRMRHLVSEKC